MPRQHVNEDYLDRYALGMLSEELLPEVEEHLLGCVECQLKLKASDEFAGLFRTAAVLPDLRPVGLWSRVMRRPVLNWAAAAAVAAALVVAVAQLRAPGTAPAAVLLQSVRGPESAVQVAAGQPAFLLFDAAPVVEDEPYEVRVVDPMGAEVVKAQASISDGHLAVFLKKLHKGGYWVRLYRRDGELISEYGLQAK